MDIKSSWLPDLLLMPLMLVNGVLAPLTEPAGVDVEVEASTPADFLAAFSARRFCLDDEGAMSLTLRRCRW